MTRRVVLCLVGALVPFARHGQAAMTLHVRAGSRPPAPTAGSTVVDHGGWIIPAHDREALLAGEAPA